MKKCTSAPVLIVLLLSCSAPTRPTSATLSGSLVVRGPIPDSVDHIDLIIRRMDLISGGPWMPGDNFFPREIVYRTVLSCGADLREEHDRRGNLTTLSFERSCRPGYYRVYADFPDFDRTGWFLFTDEPRILQVEGGDVRKGLRVELHFYHFPPDD